MVRRVDSMQALQVVAFGETPKFCQVNIPVLASHQVLLRIKACGLNFADLLMIKGSYQDTPEPPFTLGLELAGEIIDIGADVTTFHKGQHVAVYSGQGGLAEFGVFDAECCIAVPEALDVITAAGFQIAYGTSHLALDHRAQLKKGETLVVLGAAGGVGLTAVEIGKRLGARVVAVARGDEKLSIASRAGADHLIDVDSDDLRGQIKSLGGADVVYDPVGGDRFSDLFRATNPDGRILIIGFASGNIPEIKANHMMVKNISLLGVNWGAYLRFNSNALRNSLATLLDWAAKGDLKPYVRSVLPFSQTLEGFQMLATRKAVGKIVIQMQ